MATASQTIKLQNGVEIPALGFGCAFTTREHFLPEQAWAPISTALKVGYRHFDTALIYSTGPQLGTLLGLKYAEGSLKRSDVFITTKVFHDTCPISLKTTGRTMNLSDPAIDIKKETLVAVEKSLDEMGVGFVDLLLIHWPGSPDLDEATNRRYRKECWLVFEELYKQGRARAIGVSNFLKRHLEALIEDTNIVPMVNQIEYSPYLQQPETKAYCQEKGIVIEAWAPFGSGVTGVLQEPVLIELAAKHKKSVGQVILRWLNQHGMVALPKSSNETRMRENLDIFDFELSPEEMGSIDGLHRGASCVCTADCIP